MKLHELKAPQARKARKRVGRGSSSGQGNTCLLYTSPSPRD